MNKSRNAKPRLEKAGDQPEKRVHKLESTDYLVYAILGAACFSLFLPIIVNSDFYNPFVFLKSILFRIVVQVMLFMYLILALISRKYRPRFNRIFWSLFIWVAVMLFCSLPGISTNAWKSWWGTFARMDGMFTQLHLLAYFLVLFQTLRKENEWRVLFTASLFSSVFMGFSGLLQSLGFDWIYPFAARGGRVGGATGNPDFFASYMMLNFCIGIYFLVKRDRKDVYPFIAKIWLVLMLVLDVALVFCHIASGGRLLSDVLDFLPLTLSVLLLHGAVFAWYLMRQRVWAGAAFLSLISVFDLIWMIQSQTRAAAVGLAAGLAFVAFLYVCKGTDKRLRWAGAVIFFAVAIMPMAIYGIRESSLVRSNPLLSRLTGTTLTERRFIAWKAGVAGIADRPIWGWGLEQYRKAFDLHAPVELFRGEEAQNWDDRAHNILLDVGTTTGLLGLGAFLTFYLFVFSFLLRRWFGNPRETECLSMAGILAAYLFQNLFIFDTLDTNVITYLILAYTAYLCSRTEPVSEQIARDPKTAIHAFSWKEYSVLAISAGGILFAFHYLVQRPLDSNRLLLQGVALARASTSPQAKAGRIPVQSVIGTFERAGEYRTTGSYEVREEFANYACDLSPVAGVSLQDKSDAARMAIALLEKSILEDPIDCRHYMYIATLINKVLETLKQSDSLLANALAKRSLEVLQKAETLGPNRPRIFLERAQSMLFLGRTDETIAALRIAMERDPNNKRIAIDFVTVCISAGRYPEADDQRQKIGSSRILPSDYERWIGLYALRKKFDPMVALYKEQLKATPDNMLIMGRLAATYREMGDMDAARETALAAAKVSPQAAAQLQDFLKTLEIKPKK